MHGGRRRALPVRLSVCARAGAGGARRHRAREYVFMEHDPADWFCLVGSGRKRTVPYSIQWLKRLRPALFRQDLIALFDLLSTAEDQATYRAAISSCRAKTGARAAREGRRDGQNRARAAADRRLNQERRNNRMQRTELRAAADAERLRGRS